jgi:hypothetical protein
MSSDGGDMSGDPGRASDSPYDWRVRTALLDPAIGREFADVSAAEFQVLATLQNGTPVQANFGDESVPRLQARTPDPRSLRAVALLVVHLIRMGTISAGRTGWRFRDGVFAFLAIESTLFVAGWVLAEGFTGTTLVVFALTGTATAVVVARLWVAALDGIRHHRGLSLARRAERSGTRPAVEPVLTAEIPRLSRQRRLALRLGQPVLAAQISAEIKDVEHLLRRIDDIDPRDLGWSLRLELSTRAPVPRVRFGRELSAAALGLITGLPLSRDTAGMVARRRFGRLVEARVAAVAVAARELASR